MDDVTNPLIRKLMGTHHLTDVDCVVLNRLCTPGRIVGAGQDIILQGDPPNDLHLVLDGFAHRYKVLPDGSRQIVGVLLPGDFCDLHSEVLGVVDHSIGTLTECVIVDIPPVAINEVIERSPRIARALWWASLVDEGTLREWLLSLGRREAVERLAHLFCELRLRLRSVGLASAHSYGMPLRQTDLADVLGMTNVHVNRSLKALREEGLVILVQRRLTIPDVDRLQAFCDFDPTYLHLDRQQPADGA